MCRYEGHPEGHQEEMVALFDQRLQVEGGDSGESRDYQLTSYTVYCDKGHVVRFDTDLIQKVNKIKNIAFNDK